MTYMGLNKISSLPINRGFRDRNLVGLLPAIREEILSLVPLLPATSEKTRERISSALNLSLHARISPSQAIALLNASPSLITTYLHVTKEDVKIVLDRQHEIAGELLKKTGARKAWIAIDTTKMPYYGKFQRFIFNDEAGKPCLLYATAVAVLRKSYVPLMMRQLDFPPSKIDILESALKAVDESGLRLEGVLLDRYFYDVAVVNYLKNRRTRFIIGAKKTKKVKELVANLPKGKVLITPYIMKSSQGATADVWLVAFWRNKKLITLTASDAEKAENY